MLLWGRDDRYDPLNFDLSITGFREVATNSEALEGIRSEWS